MSEANLSALQIAIRNNHPLAVVPMGERDTLATWAEIYLQFEVTTAPSSRLVQRRDIGLFLDFLAAEEGGLARPLWTPRVSRAFLDHLRATIESNRRRWNDRTINRILAHLKTFAKWVHKLAPFPLGNPMEKMRSVPTASSLAIDRAITPRERRRILDAADMLAHDGGRSVDRKRYRGKERPQRGAYRPWRNRAMVYLLIETGMRRAAVTALNLADVDFRERQVSAIEKGGVRHAYQISREGLEAVQAYIVEERGQDADMWGSPALFLASSRNAQGVGHMSPQTVNLIWREVCRVAGVEGRTPHSARHSMGKHIMEKTGNVAAVQRQLGHKNAAYSLQYARVSNAELQTVLDQRA